MTDRAEIERLLNRTGRTLEGLPTQDDYWYSDDYVDRNEEIGMMMYRSGFKRNEPYIMHQSDVIELLVGALRDALTERDAALAKVPKWISVEERLPDTTDVYLIHTVHRYNKNDGYRCMDVRLFFKGEFEPWQGLPDIYEVTHWMPLPEPPKDGE